MGLLGLILNEEYNRYMIAYDIPLSALLYIIDMGIPLKDMDEATDEEILAYIEMLKRIQEEGNDGL